MKEDFPYWLGRGIPRGRTLLQTKRILKENNLNTICNSAKCPNLGKCYSRGTAAFLIMGDICTRNCGFCAVEKGKPKLLDILESKRIAKVVKKLGLKYAVITSVTRDDLEDGGAGHFARVIRQIRWQNPKLKIEVLIPDFQGNFQSLETVIDAYPDVLNHNLETVPRLYKTCRPKADYQRSLKILSWSKMIDPRIPTKSGLMLGLGETKKEIIKVMKDLRKIECDFLTLGQYLAPSKDHLPVERYVRPEEFAMLKKEALQIGFKGVASAPLVRSSYLAEKLLEP